MPKFPVPAMMFTRRKLYYAEVSVGTEKSDDLPVGVEARMDSLREGALPSETYGVTLYRAHDTENFLNMLVQLVGEIFSAMR